MKKYLLIMLCALVSCVGQKDDPEETGPSGEPVAKTGAGIVLDFTATWCVNCPRMTTAIEEAAAEKSLIPVCVHFQDAMVCDQGKELIGHFGVQAYPSAVMNMDASTLITATSKELIFAKLASSFSEKAPGTIDAAFLADGSVNVKFTAAEEGAYTLSAALVEDGIVAAQTGASDSFIHNAVFRRFLQENLLGDSLGQISAGASVERAFDSGVSSGKFRVVVFVCYDGKVNSAVSVKAPFYPED